jgi:hypothetical protein
LFNVWKEVVLDATLHMVAPTTTIHTVVPKAFLPKRSCHKTANKEILEFVWGMANNWRIKPRATH